MCICAYVHQRAQTLRAFDGGYSKDQADFPPLTKTKGLEQTYIDNQMNHKSFFKQLKLEGAYEMKHLNLR